MIRSVPLIRKYRRAVKRKERLISISGGLLAVWRLSLCLCFISRARARAGLLISPRRQVLTRIRVFRLAGAGVSWALGLPDPPVLPVPPVLWGPGGRGPPSGRVSLLFARRPFPRPLLSPPRN